MRFLRLQSAMEYLMTYGWSILIIAVVLGALFQLGVFNSANFAPRAQPGNCHVFKSSQGATLEGVCSGELPQFAGVFSSAGSSYVNVPTGLVNNALATSKGFTVAGWFLSTVSNYRSGFFNGYNIYLGVENNGYDGCAVHGPTSWTESSGSINVADGTWHFLAITFNGYVCTVYVGMVKDIVLSTPATWTDNGGSPTLAIGNSGDGASSSSQMADVQLYNTTLSGPEVNALYLEGIGGAPVLPTNVIGWWPLNGDATDYSGSNNNGVPSGVTYTSAWTSGYTIP